MKNTLIVALLTSCLVFGCTTNQIPSDPKDPTFTEVLAKSKTEIKTGAEVATSIYLLSIKDVEKRKSSAQKLNAFATKVEDAIKADISTDDIKLLLVKFLTENSSDDQKLLAVLLQSIADSIQTQLNIKFDINLDTTKLLITRELILSATGGVKTITSVYNG